MRPRALVAALLAIFAAVASSSSAQTADPARGRIELGIGLTRVGANAFGTNDALLVGADGSPYRLFRTTTMLAGASGGEARVGIRVTRALQVEATGSYTIPEIRTSIGSDAESAPALAVSEPVRQIVIGGAAVVSLPRWRLGRAVPFATVGAGYLRQLHEGQTLVATGRTLHAGGGVKYLLSDRPGGRLKGVGVRADIVALARRRGVAFDGGTHLAPVLSASLFARF